MKILSPIYGITKEKEDGKMSEREKRIAKIIEWLTMHHETIATMESCTGGAIVNALTNIEGASRVIRFGVVTYSNDFKIKLGVDAKLIEHYTVYSMEVAKEMSQKITDYAESDYGIGITGQLNRLDPNNPTAEHQTIYLSLYDAKNHHYETRILKAQPKSRPENKQWILDHVLELIEQVLV